MRFTFPRQPAANIFVSQIFLRQQNPDAWMSSRFIW